MLEMYLEEATVREERLERYKEARDRLVAAGATVLSHPDFGSFATVRHSIAVDEASIE